MKQSKTMTSFSGDLYWLSWEKEKQNQVNKIAKLYYYTRV